MDTFDDLDLPVRLAHEIPAEMIDAIAAGLEEPKDIASRHGFDSERWAKLSGWKPFLDAVASRRAEFERDGLTFRLKRAMQADVLSDKYFQLLLGNDASISQISEGVKVFAKLGDMEPKNTVQAQVGSGFSITINMGENTPSKPKIDVKTSEIVDVTPKKGPQTQNEQPKLHTSGKRKTVSKE